MKNIIKSAFLILMITLGFSACKKDDNSSNSVAAMNSTLQQGSWRITSFIDSGNNETSHYSNYSFQFGSGGTVSATNSGGTVSGTWSNGNDDSQVKLVLNFNSIDPFSELNEDWHVTQQSSTIIKLEHISGGNGGIDYLTFEKI
ncbi:MAG: hypothetical protein ACO1G6_00725 [Bacteroidota bacterium]